tara:strand:+ start:6469 stop:8811 length:2343 start_codon:yes stop_codon:yes gene_type:complete
MATTDINVRLIDETKAGFKNINNNMKGLQSSTSSLTSGFLKLGAALATSFAVKGIVNTAASFQDLRTSLSLLLKDTEKGAQAFDKIKTFATKSIFSVNDLTNAFVKLKAAGIEPTDKLLNTFQDTAAIAADSLGAFQAITDLFVRTTAGGLGLEELERLADKGIPVYDILREKLGLVRGEISEVGKSAQGSKIILESLQEGLNERFGGAVEARVKNVSQAFNNFGDTLDNLADEIGQGGLNEALADIVTQFGDFINANKELARELGQTLGSAITFIAENIKLLTAASVAWFTVFAVGKILAVAKAFGLLNSIMGKNIFIKLATGALALTGGVLTYLGLTTDEAKETAKALDDAAEAAKKMANTGTDGGGDSGGRAKLLALQTQKLGLELDKLTEKYALGNKSIQDRIQLETDQIGLTQEQIEMSKLRQEADQKLANAQLELQSKIDKINQSQKSPELKAKEIGMIKAAQDALTASTNLYKDSLGELFEAQQKQADVTEAINWGLDQQTKNQQKVKDIQDDMAKITMTDIEKKHYDIARAAEREAEIVIDAYKRKRDAAGLPYETDVIEEYERAGVKAVEEITRATQEHYELSREWETGWDRAFKEYVENATNAATQAEAVFGSMTRGMEDMLLKFIKTGDMNWRDFVQGIVDELLKAQIAKLIADVFGGLLDIGGGGDSKKSSGGGFWSKAGSFVGGILGFADGGTIPHNGPVMVGERGPEILSGVGGRTVTPNESLGGTSVTYNINAVDARSFQDLLASNPQALHAIAERGRMSMTGAR